MLFLKETVLFSLLASAAGAGMDHSMGGTGMTGNAGTGMGSGGYGTPGTSGAIDDHTKPSDNSDGLLLIDLSLTKEEPQPVVEDPLPPVTMRTLAPGECPAEAIGAILCFEFDQPFNMGLVFNEYQGIGTDFELNNYVSGLSTINNGYLAMEARDNGDGTSSSTWLNTQNLLEMRGGILKVALQAPDLTQGLWVLMSIFGYGGPPFAGQTVGEFDFASLGEASAVRNGDGNRNVYMGASWMNSNNFMNFAGYSSTYGQGTPGLNMMTYVYELRWLPGSIDVYVNDQMIWSFDITEMDREEFRDWAYLSFRMSVAGGFTSYTGMASGQANWIRSCANGIFTSDINQCGYTLRGYSGVTFPTSGSYVGLIDWIRFYETSSISTNVRWRGSQGWQYYGTGQGIRFTTRQANVGTGTGTVGGGMGPQPLPPTFPPPLPPTFPPPTVPGPPLIRAPPPTFPPPTFAPPTFPPPTFSPPTFTPPTFSPPTFTPPTFTPPTFTPPTTGFVDPIPPPPTFPRIVPQPLAPPPTNPPPRVAPPTNPPPTPQTFPTVGVAKTSNTTPQDARCDVRAGGKGKGKGGSGGSRAADCGTRARAGGKGKGGRKFDAVLEVSSSMGVTMTLAAVLFVFGIAM